MAWWFESAGSSLIRSKLDTAPARAFLSQQSGFALSFAAVIIALVAGWFGGELVDRLGVGVDDGANLNAPSSLSGKKIETSERLRPESKKAKPV